MVLFKYIWEWWQLKQIGPFPNGIFMQCGGYDLGDLLKKCGQTEVRQTDKQTDGRADTEESYSLSYRTINEHLLNGVFPLSSLLLLFSALWW